ncbi:AAA family ATPase [Herbaspirillum lusitanum]|uniref:AAA family ATPase n=1 Tax=Herbaspirillum lusitanum TaxID=213312 RepID=A0ABW9A9Z1_9BURK
MLTGLQIRNFKGIEGPIEIPIKPVTLLYGVNSVGKSSVLHSMHFMRGVLENNDLNPKGSPYAADDIDLGGFLNLLHKHRTGSRMVLGYSLNLDSIDLPEYEAASAISISDKLKDAHIEFGFSVDDQDHLPKLDYYLVSLNGVDVALVMPDTVQAAAGRKRLAYINVRNPLLVSAAQSQTGDTSTEVIDLNLRKLIPRIEDDDDLDAELVGASQEEIGNRREEKKKELAAEYTIHSTHRDLLTYPVTGFRSGLPRWGKLVSSPVFEELSGEEFGNKVDDVDLLELTPGILTELIVGPLEVLRDLLADSRAIGPLRTIPKRRLNLGSEANEADWYGGLAAWYRLHESSQSHLAEVHTWLYESNRLGTGYGLEREESREVPLQYLDAVRPGASSTLEINWASVDSLPVTRRVWLIDTKNQVKVTPHDVGVGLSQLIPIVTAAVDQHASLLLIEQPELHIHPRVQVGLGDLFLQAARKFQRNFLIETHSEALLLRMMKRIRQTQDGELPKEIPPASADDIAVYLIQNEGKGVAIMEMRMNDRGEFLKPWPKGLFEESLRETF